jgi:hypothetical protein
MLPELAVIVVLPSVVPAVAKPELLMVATSVADDFQVTVVLTSLLDPSPNVPVAVNCWVLLG